MRLKGAVGHPRRLGNIFLTIVSGFGAPFGSNFGVFFQVFRNYFVVVFGTVPQTVVCDLGLFGSRPLDCVIFATPPPFTRGKGASDQQLLLHFTSGAIPGDPRRSPDIAG